MAQHVNRYLPSAQSAASVLLIVEDLLYSIYLGINCSVERSLNCRFQLLSSAVWHLAYVTHLRSAEVAQDTYDSHACLTA